MAITTDASPDKPPPPGASPLLPGGLSPYARSPLPVRCTPLTSARRVPDTHLGEILADGLVPVGPSYRSPARRIPSRGYVGAGEEAALFSAMGRSEGQSPVAPRGYAPDARENQELSHGQPHPATDPSHNKALPGRPASALPQRQLRTGPVESDPGLLVQRQAGGLSRPQLRTGPVESDPGLLVQRQARELSQSQPWRGADSSRNDPPTGLGAEVLSHRATGGYAEPTVLDGGGGPRIPGGDGPRSPGDCSRPPGGGSDVPGGNGPRGPERSRGEETGGDDIPPSGNYWKWSASRWESLRLLPDNVRGAEALSELAAVYTKVRIKFKAQRGKRTGVVRVEAFNVLTGKWELVEPSPKHRASLAEIGIGVVTEEAESAVAKWVAAPTQLDKLAELAKLLHAGMPVFVAKLIGAFVEQAVGPLFEPEGGRGVLLACLEDFTVVCDVGSGQMTSAVVDVALDRLADELKMRTKLAAA